MFERHFALCGLLLLLAGSACNGGPAPSAAPSTPSAADQRLGALIDADWEWRMQAYPEWATDIGDLRYNDQLTDMSAAAIAARRQHWRDLQHELLGVERAQLSPRAQLDYDLLRFEVDLEVEGDRFPSELLQLSPMGGVHTELASLVQTIPLDTQQHVEQFVARLRAGASRVDQHIALLEEGLARGVTAPKVILRDVPALIRKQLPERVTDSPIYQLAFSELPASIPAAEQDRLRREAATILERELLPAYRRLLEFVERDYLPRARDSIGMSALPDGAAWYALRVREMTTTRRTPDEIHALGLTEVARIRAEMERVKASTGFAGTLAEFFTFLRTDERFFYRDAESLVRGYRDVAKRIDPGLPRLFGKLPRLTYGVLPIPDFQAPTQTTAYYQPGSPRSGRAGIFYANTYDLKARPRWEMEALTLHEAVPGHHLQIALSQELEEVPNFRRYGGNTAFVEGWALYGESLGEELDLFRDPYAKFGQLTYEMWRAIRLVVDTGMHAKGWTREQAISFFRDNAGKTEHDIVVEVDRYLSWPGQALAYKLGELEIKRLRGRAMQALGQRFDVRAFHDEVLGVGAIPLDVLAARIEAWIDRSR